MFELGLMASFEAAHSLRGDFGPAQRLHGHTYKVEVGVTGPTLQASGILLDVGVLQDACSAAISPLHMQCLDTVPSLHGLNTTVEVLAEFIHRKVKDALGAGSNLHLRVRVWESPTVWGGYEGPLA